MNDHTYPRPQLKRSSFMSLNGSWEFYMSENEDFPSYYNRNINVPFCPESELSGIKESVPPGTYLFYRKIFSLPEGFIKSRVLLNFGAVDQYALIKLNGKIIADHEGGYEHFSVDITGCLKDENILEVCAWDNLDGLLPFGKQKVKRGGMWYTPVSGIWQSVWLESVCDDYIKKIKISCDINSALIEVTGPQDGLITLESGEEFILKDGRAKVTPEKVMNWSPEEPYLYNFTLRAGEDEVSSYFALRTLEVKDIDGVPRLCLNGKPYFFNGLLDQGYFEKGIFTPEDPSDYEKDILTAKRLGFNTLRKHIKIEPEAFYYACDRLGMAVFQDMVNNGKYSFFKDSALPMIGFQGLSDKKMNKDEHVRSAFIRSMEKTAGQLYDHPCICCWTIFNEGWGQFDSSKMYDLLKELDESRFIDSASGWFSGGKSDVKSLHVYFKKFKMPKPSGKPVVLSEFGGYVYKIPEHSFNKDKTFGYKFFKDKDEYADAVKKLYADEIFPNIEKGLCAAIYTQITDVEDETNGLMTYDREIVKLPEGWMEN